ncbi:MAG TPA: hypothetical protein VNU95_12615 [Candidatus Acidoferrales bacterium]|nr:hypothetical protein [Candidatus Acidoferrales bacterium]
MNQPNRQTKAVKTEPKTRPIRIAFPAVLAIILAVLFAKSFLPDFVHFSNDGPLGEQNTAWSRFPMTMTGTWDDLNDIGNSGGAVPPDFTMLATWILKPVAFSKFFTPIALFVLGIGAWTFFRQLGLSSLAAALGALATALNSGFFGNACWGTSPQQVAMGFVFFALALVVGISGETPPRTRWLRLALAGMAVGLSVVEGADNGAIFSLFVAAYVIYQSLVRKITWTPTEHKVVWLVFNLALLGGLLALFILHIPHGALLAVLLLVGAGVWNYLMTASYLPFQRLAHSSTHVGLIAVFAGLIAAQTITSLVGVNILGAAGMGDNSSIESKLEHWDWATEWSLPKKETLGMLVPGLFGYRMDTPKDMMDFVQDSYKNGEYWGGMGRSPDIDRFFDSGASGSPPGGMMRFGYAGYYAGILVALVALFAFIKTVAQTIGKQNSVFSAVQRHFIWFWALMGLVALLLSWGRFAPFYQYLYMLPYFSTIRNPVKFTSIFYLALIIIFAYGIDAFSRCYLQVSGAGADGKTPSPSKSWWGNLRGFNRKWSIFCLAAFGVSLLAWLVYSGEENNMVQYLGKVGFPDANTARDIFNFSLGQYEWFLLFFAGSVILVILTLAGVFSGKRAQLGGLLLGALLVIDMGRANLPWIIHWDYKQKYASNQIIDFLRDKPYEHRVTDIPSQSLFENLYRIEWMQHHFPYYNVQCSDIIQSPRVASDLAAYDLALAPTPTTSYLVARKWQLSNTSYLLGPSAYLDSINEQLDPEHHRFQIVQRFNIVAKPGVDVEQLQQKMQQGIFEGEKLTAVPDASGDYALFQFTGALPRAKLYTDWQTNTLADFQNFTTKSLDDKATTVFDDVGTNGYLTLAKLTSPGFDPEQTVLLDAPLPQASPTAATGQDSGTVEFKSYSAKDIVFSAQAVKPSVLLVNDKFDPGWHVFVDGKAAELLRCNFIMRGVFVPPGAHTIEFAFSLPHAPLYVTLVAMIFGVLLCCLLFFATRNPPESAALNPPTEASQTDKEGRASAGKRNPSSEAARPASH